MHATDNLFTLSHRSAARALAADGDMWAERHRADTRDKPVVFRASGHIERWPFGRIEGAARGSERV